MLGCVELVENVRTLFFLCGLDSLIHPASRIPSYWSDIPSTLEQHLRAFTILLGFAFRVSGRPTRSGDFAITRGEDRKRTRKQKTQNKITTIQKYVAVAEQKE